MKKALLFLSVVALILMSLVGCGDSSKTSATTTVRDAMSTTTTIVTTSSIVSSTDISTTTSELTTKATTSTAKATTTTTKATTSTAKATTTTTKATTTTAKATTATTKEKTTTTTAKPTTTKATTSTTKQTTTTIAPIPDPEGWSYTISDGKATITEVSTKFSGTVIVPSTLGGCPVVKIGVWAFWGCSDMTSLTIPDSVTSIDHEAFAKCTALTTITVGSGMKSIGYPDAFYECKKLTTITISKDNPFYSSQDGVLFSKDKTVLIGYIDKKSEGTYTIPQGVTTIGFNAFYDCNNLTEITIPNSVTRIEDAFDNCTQLTAITVSEKNKAYSSQDGVLLNKNKSELICYPIEKKASAYTIPKSVTSISYGAFTSCKNLISITIPDGVTIIDEYVFSGCESLTSVTIPASVEQIKNHAFEGCYSLTDVYYGGANRDKLDIGSHYSDSLFEATWHYNVK